MGSTLCSGTLVTAHCYGLWTLGGDAGAIGEGHSGCELQEQVWRCTAVWAVAVRRMSWA